MDTALLRLAVIKQHKPNHAESKHCDLVIDVCYVLR